ncbi:MAG: YigZ family protein [Clostridia bacterium]
MAAYKTLKAASETEIVERRSVFLGYAAPADTEEKALKFLELTRKQNSDATHNVYAYIIRENNISRFSDDGEPRGTAGIPVLDILRKEEITDAVVVVTRYFGGILLGSGGLVRAYSASAKKALDMAQIVVCRSYALFEVACDYSEFQKLSRFFELAGISIKSVLYTENVSVTAACIEESFELTCLKIADITSGKCCANKKSIEFISE